MTLTHGSGAGPSNGPDAPLEAAVRRHPAGGVGNRRLSAEQAARIAARSVCPTCDGRDANRAEESYASCIFCATGTRKPVLPEFPAAQASDAASVDQPLAPVVALHATHPRPAAAAFGDDEPLALD